MHPVISRLSSTLRSYGPGIAVAATGVGAGDLVAASVAGAQYGTAVLWAALVGAVIKYVLNEGIARWQLATGTTILEGWITRLPRFVSYYFLVYLILWSFIVAAALISACGLAAHAMIPDLSVTTWGILHSLAGVVLVMVGRYALFERLMKLFTGVMFLTVLACAVLLVPHVSFSWPALPTGSPKFILGVIGGVGGSVTLLSYCYWIREKGWTGREYMKTSRRDLGLAYTLTGFFGAAMIVIAAGVHPDVVTGNSMALEVARRVDDTVGVGGKWMFLVGFWGAVFTSLFGVWQSVPYLFADFVRVRKGINAPIGPDSIHYKAYLAYLALPPLVLLIFGRPVWIIVIYTIAGAMFMPFLAGTLLWMNNRSTWLGGMRTSPVTNVILWVSLGLFAYLAVVELVEM